MIKSISAISYWRRVSLAIAILLLTQVASAAAPVCHSGAYCDYTGTVVNAYANSRGDILIYFEAPLDINQAASVGFSGVLDGSACSFLISDSPEYAKILYASALSAQARGSSVKIQMIGSYAGYVKCDRIWVLPS